LIEEREKVLAALMSWPVLLACSFSAIGSGAKQEPVHVVFLHRRFELVVDAGRQAPNDR